MRWLKLTRPIVQCEKRDNTTNSLKRVLFVWCVQCKCSVGLEGEREMTLACKTFRPQYFSRGQHSDRTEDPKHVLVQVVHPIKGV